MGDGIAIYPDNNIIVAPCDGKITAIMENTEHAVGITLANGVELLIHVGLDAGHTTSGNGTITNQNHGTIIPSMPPGFPLSPF